jgi:hypothetical protein
VLLYPLYLLYFFPPPGPKTCDVEKNVAKIGLKQSLFGTSGKHPCPPASSEA